MVALRGDWMLRGVRKDGARVTRAPGLAAWDLSKTSSLIKKKQKKPPMIKNNRYACTEKLLCI